jgi:hypothetical protein
MEHGVGLALRPHGIEGCIVHGVTGDAGIEKRAVCHETEGTLRAVQPFPEVKLFGQPQGGEQGRHVRGGAAQVERAQQTAKVLTAGGALRSMLLAVPPLHPFHEPRAHLHRRERSTRRLHFSRES